MRARPPFHQLTRLAAVVLAAAGVAWGATAANAQAAPSQGEAAPATQPSEAGGDDQYKPWEDSPRTKTPDVMKGVDITQNLGATLPLDTRLTNSEGETVTLGRYFEQGGDQPVILNFAYYECPVLCSLIMEGLAKSVSKLGWTPGDRFRIVTISIDPGETPELARKQKRDILGKLSMDGAGDGWHFHTAAKDQVQPLAKQAGFGYKYLPDQDQYVHKPAIILASPDGRISQYLTGIQFPAKKVESAIEKAGAGKLGEKKSTSFLQTCLRYIKDTGFVSEARGIMKLGGALTVLVIAVAIGLALAREASRRQREHAKGNQTSQ